MTDAQNRTLEPCQQCQALPKWARSDQKKKKRKSQPAFVQLYILFSNRYNTKIKHKLKKSFIKTKLYKKAVYYILITEQSTVQKALIQNRRYNETGLIGTILINTIEHLFL